MIKVKYIVLVGLCLFFSFITFAEDKNPINENNWLNHPLIVEIRSIYNEVEDLISKQTLTKRKKEFEDEGPGITEKEIYFDINNIARKFVMKGGSEDSALKYSFYYDSKQVLRFVFIEGGAVCGSVRESQPVPDIYEQLGKKYGMSDDLVETFRRNKEDPKKLDALFDKAKRERTTGGKPEQQYIEPTNKGLEPAREALGEGPEIDDALQVGNRTVAGMARKPRHHIFPQEYRDYFEKRGFPDIDDFTVELDTATHQAIHGGGDYQRGRTWPGEWNRLIMAELQKAESRLNRLLTRDEIIKIGDRLKRKYRINKKYIPYTD